MKRVKQLKGRSPATADAVLDRLTKLHVNLMLSRSTQFGDMTPYLTGRRNASSTLDVGNRNLDRECQFIEGDPTLQQYRMMYDQEGVATRIVSLLANECWVTYPDLYETEGRNSTAFERDWDDLRQALDPWHYLHRLDELSGIGHFGVLLLGLNDGNPFDKRHPGIDEKGQKTGKIGPKESKLLYLMPFSEDLVRVSEFEKDPANPRFGQPKFYQITMSDPTAMSGSSANIPDVKQQVVHWSRLLHFTGTPKSSNWCGVPLLRNQHRRVYNVRKILGSAGEMFYKGGFPGMSFEADPGLMEVADIDLKSLKQEIEAYSEGLQRYIRLVGMTAKSLAPQVADPSKHLMAEYRNIALTMDVPLKVFMGTESGQEAGQQDTHNHNRRIMRRENLILTTKMIRPFADRLVALGVLSPPRVPDRYIVSWADLNGMTDKDKSDRALKMAQAILQYVTSGSAEFVRPYEFLTLVLNLTRAEATHVIKAAGGEDAILKKLEKMQQAQAGNTPNSTGTNPTKQTGAGGRTNGLGRPAKNKTKSRNGGNATK